MNLYRKKLLKKLVKVSIIFTLLFVSNVYSQITDTLWSENWEGNWSDNWHVDAGTWEVGSPSSGPDSAYNGQNCAGTSLSGNYPGTADTRLIRHSSFIVPPASSNPRLRLWHWYSIESYDYGKVQIRVNGGSWDDLSGNYVHSSGGVWTNTWFDLSAYADSTVEISFYLYAQGSSSSTGWYIDNIQVITGPIISNNPENWESGLDNWNPSHGIWEVGSPTSGPGTAYSGQNCAATILGGKYPGSADSRLISPPFIISSTATNPALRFWHWYSIEGYDYGKVQIRVNGGSWEDLSGKYVSTSGGVWTNSWFDLSAYADSTVEIAFYFHAQGSSSSTGWYIDDINIVGYEPPIFYTSPEVIDFGNVAKNIVHTDTLTLRNYTDTVIQVNSISITGINAANFELGNSLTSVAPLTTEELYINFTAEHSQDYLASLEIDTDCGNKIVPLKGTGGLPNISILIDSLNMGDVVKEKTKIDSIAITNDGIDELIISNITLSGSFFYSETDTIHIAAGDEYDLKIRYNPQSVGAHSSLMTIFSNATNASQYKISLTGNCIPQRPKLVTSTNNLAFGYITKGHHIDSVITISNQGIDELFISDIQISNDVFSVDVDSAHVAVGNSTDIYVHLYSTELGVKNGTLAIISNDPDNPTYNISLSATIQTPIIIVNDNFFVGSTVKNQPQDSALVIQNSSGVTLTIQSMEIDNPEFTIKSDTSFIINANSSAEVQLEFISDSFGLKSAILNINSDDPDNLSTTVALSATVVAPSLSVDSIFNIGCTEKNVTNTNMLNIKNTTIAPLNIWDLTLDNPAFSIQSDTAITIPGNSSRNIILAFRSPEYGKKEAILSFKTDDPDNLSKNVLITSTVLSPTFYCALDSLNFGPIQRGFTKKLNLELQNTATVILTITNISFDNDNFTNLNSNNFTINANSSKVIQVQVISQELGYETGNIQIETDDPDNETVLIPLAAEIREVDTTSPEMTIIDIPTEVVSGGFNDVQVKIKASDNQELISVFCYYKGITEDMWLSVELTESDNNYSASIPFSAFDEIGLEFYFLLSDWVNNQTRSAIKVANLMYVSNGLQSSSLIFGNKVSDYQIISFPLILDNKDIIGTLENDLGFYNDEKWRLFQYQESTNVEVGKGLSNFEIGKGYWLITKDEIQKIDSGPGKTVKVSSDSFYVMKLKKGWNQIGNPFDFDISWAVIKSRNTNNNKIGVYKTFEREFIQTDRIKRFGGGFIFADEEIELKIPPVKKNNISKFAKNYFSELQAEMDENNWQLPLKVCASDLTYKFSAVGMNKEAKDSKDKFDEMTLPRFMKYLEINFYHPEYFYQRFTKDIVKSTKNKIWEFDIEASFHDKHAILSWPEINFLQEKQIFLFDKESQKKVNMIEKNEFQFVLDMKHSFAIYFGDEKFISENLLPDKIILSQNYPNPFNASTTIEFTIPGSIKDPKAVLNIYNVAGQKIFTLINGSLSAGFYKIDWNGKNPFGKEASSGIYFCSLQVRDGSKIVSINTKKMILIK